MANLKTCVFSLCMVALTPTVAVAAECPEGYPDGPITFRVGYGAGGGTDAVARKVASLIEEQAGWTVVVENRPGASGGVMATELMREDADGSIVGVASNTTLAINPWDNPDTVYTYEDFRYMGTGMLLNYGLVALKDKPYDTLEEFIAAVEEMGRGTVSVGAASHEIAVRAIADHFGVNLVPIPGKGSAAALQEALGGHVDATVQSTQHVPQIKAGKMVQLATLTDTRAVYAPDVPTLKEEGLDVSIEGHIFFMLPKDTPDDIHACLSETLAEATSSEAYGEFMAKLETEAMNMGPDGTRDWLEEASAFYKESLSGEQ
ncbi:tripartite tricarboxylate transporter substrate binding protein [Psychromarinibacter sp. C21-152]|uniref:Tripartite tricarboxylate transporter substrate binding protein n=1 Tax=Psychromarinibacter sediminicola TaxID=3033385 RepID=A0AAE3NUU1_9RHOB|nr:tripartite tricarboxylate transporter substrate binding protein [Psychromarinibacter sediminicola]MDF0601380.1 tripartite tricarboxylate transporter substrate binding protein [Psychromarinibacter sediminicola]